MSVRELYAHKPVHCVTQNLQHVSLTTPDRKAGRCECPEYMEDAHVKEG